MDDSMFQVYYDLGKQDKNWYSMHRQAFQELFEDRDMTLIANLFAATSINSSLKSNIRLFRKALHEIENNKPFSNYLPVMLKQLERIRAGEPIQGRKIKNFAAALSGDTDAVVVDIWLLRAFGLDRKYFRSRSQRKQSGGATTSDYNKVEHYVKERANQMGLKPCELSAILWAGCRIYHTGDRNTRYIWVLFNQLYNMHETKSTINGNS